nr:hypothetical protein [Tanacetum cinerariifolium]
LWKDEKRLRKLRNMEVDAGTKANEMERFELHNECISGHERRKIMERSPMCEELERDVGRRNWLQMMIVYLRKYADKHKDFALSVNRLVEDINKADLDRRAFVRELRECKLRDLTKEAREIAIEIESFLLKLVDKEPFHTRIFEGNDKQRGLVEDINKAGLDRRAFVRELRCVSGETVPAKVAVFLEEMMNKEDSMELELCNLEREAKERVCEIKFFVGKLMRDDRAPKTQTIAALPICDELRRSVDTTDWESQFILHCRREIAEDIRLESEINLLCMRLTAIVDEKEAFADELDMLVGKYVPVEDGVKSGLFADVSFVVPFASSILIDCATAVGLVGGVAVFQEDQHKVY